MMAINSDNSIGHNQAGPGSHQNNVNSVSNKFYFNITFRKANSIEDVLGPEVEAFFHSIAEDICLPKSQPTSISRTQYCFIKDYQETSRVGADYDKCLLGYPKFKTTKSILEILKPSDNQRLRDWQSSPKSDSLILHLHGEKKARSGWTTNFTLEMIGCIIKTDNPIGGGKSSAFVAHFCSEQFDASKSTEQFILQEFLAQIHRSRHDDLLASHSCEPHGGPDEVFHSAAKQPLDLWELLRVSVFRAGIKTLYVFLDNLDYFHDRADPTVSASSFYKNIQDFLQKSQLNDVRVKLLITSKSSKIVRDFSASKKIVMTQDPDARVKSVTSR